MIVHPDFPDHWKTRHVVKATSSEAAVRAILRLWAHCQQRRRWTFPELTPVMLAAICGWDAEPQLFWDAMLATFIDQSDDGFEVHEWASVNSSLLANWEKGKFGTLGGRPKKNPQANPEGYSDPSKNPEANPEANPQAHPGLTLGKPDKRREEKIRKTPPNPLPGEGIEEVTGEQQSERQSKLPLAVAPMPTAATSHELPRVNVVLIPELRRRIAKAFQLTDREMRVLDLGGEAMRTLAALELDNPTLTALEELWSTTNGEAVRNEKVWHSLSLTAFLKSPDKDLTAARRFFLASPKPAANRSESLAVDRALYLSFIASPDHPEYAMMRDQPIPLTEKEMLSSLLIDWKKFKSRSASS